MIPRRRPFWIGAGLCVAAQAAWLLVPQQAFGVGSSCVPTPGVCHVSDAAPPCGGSVSGTDDCGGPCTVAGQARSACVAIQPIACGETGPGRDACGPCTASGRSPGACVMDERIACGETGPGRDACNRPCTVYGESAGACVPDTSLACGASGPGHNACGQVCDAVGPACPSPKVPYGFTVPGDAVYGFPSAVQNERPIIQNPVTTDFLGLAAKGNIIIGDYTSEAFAKQALPNLKPGPVSKTQPYVIDPTDAPLGYHTGVGGTMYNEHGLPLFDGNYDQEDGGYKTDGSARKFYESSLPDADFQRLAGSSGRGRGDFMPIDAVLFTNHALAGYVPGDLTVNGAMISRDDGLIAMGNMTITHDARLLSNQTTQQLALPVTIKRPKVVSWKDCSVSQCED